MESPNRSNKNLRNLGILSFGLMGTVGGWFYFQISGHGNPAWSKVLGILALVLALLLVAQILVRPSSRPGEPLSRTNSAFARGGLGILGFAALLLILVFVFYLLMFRL